MRRLLVVVILLGLMLLVRDAQLRDSISGHLITLAAIGFVVLTAFSVADMGTRISLPLVTGYITAGVALGPFAANILSFEVVSEMKMFNTLALGIIATSAGLELDLRQLVPMARTLGTAIAIKVTLGVASVAFTVLAAAKFVDLGVDTKGEAMALALIMGVLSIGTSPSIALAILKETKAKGRIAELVLGAAVFKDLVVVTALAIAAAVANVWMDDQATLGASVLVHVVKELGGSLLAGVLLGGVLIAYLRFVQAEMLLFVAAMILVVAELCAALHLELLLVFISAGFVVRNFSRYEHELAKPLELVALPVFVVFFTIAGASVNFASTWSILPAAVAICVVRAATYWVAANVSSKVGNESPEVRRNSWLAYLPQAGVTLGLVGVAAHKLPQLSSQITTAGMAVVAINLLIGPVTLRTALSNAGEIPGTQPGSKAQRTRRNDKSVAPTPAVPANDLALPPELASVVTTLESSTQTNLIALLESRASVPKLAPDTIEEPGSELRMTVVQAYRAAAAAWYEQWVATFKALPSLLEAPLTLEHLAPRPGDSWLLRLRLAVWRARFRLSPSFRRRSVPLRLCARLALERIAAQIGVRFFDESLERHFIASSPSASAHESYLPVAWQEDIDQGFRELAYLLRYVGTPRLPARRLRFSSVEQAIRDELTALDVSREEQYASRAQAYWGTEVARRQVQALRRSVTHELEAQVFQPAQSLLDRLDKAFAQLSQLLNQMSEDAKPGRESTVNVTEWRVRLSETRQKAFDELAKDFRASVVMREIGAAFRTAIGQLPTELRCYQVQANGDARQGVIRKIDLSEIAERDVIKRLIPSLDLSVRSMSNTFAHLSRRVREVLEPMLAEFDSAESLALRGDRANHLIENTKTRLAALLARTIQQVSAEVETQQQALRLALEALGQDVATAQMHGDTTTHVVRRWVSRIQRALRPLLERYSRRRRNDGVLDAATLNERLLRWRKPELPDNVLRWFSQDPVRDERIYCVKQSLLDALIDEEARWRQGERAALLLRGALGSGKTSLLNMCELELRSPRIVRLDAEGPEQARTLSEAIELALGTTNLGEGSAEGAQRPVLLVDNLAVWLTRAEEPLAELERLLTLIAHSTEAFWVLSVDDVLVARIAEQVRIHDVFTRVWHMPNLGRKALEHVIHSRALRLNLELAFKPTFLGRALDRLGLPGERLSYFAYLARQSGGNPGRALAQCVQGAEVVDNRLVLDLRSLRTSWRPFAAQLSAAQLAILLMVLRHGSADNALLQRELGLAPAQLDRETTFLRAAGLLDPEHRAHQIPDHIRFVVISELQATGALRDETTTLPDPSSTFDRKVRVATVVVIALALSYKAAQVLGIADIWPWLAGLALVLMAARHTLQNAMSGLLLRMGSGLKPGERVRLGGTSGVLRTRGLLHLEVAADDGTITLVPNSVALLQRDKVHGGFERGFKLTLRVPAFGAGSASGTKVMTRILRWCPYRTQGSPIVVRQSDREAKLELYTWKGGCVAEVEAYVMRRAGGPSQT